MGKETPKLRVQKFSMASSGPGSCPPTKGKRGAHRRERLQDLQPNCCQGVNSALPQRFGPGLTHTGHTGRPQEGHDHRQGTTGHTVIIVTLVAWSYSHWSHGKPRMTRPASLCFSYRDWRPLYCIVRGGERMGGKGEGVSQFGHMYTDGMARVEGRRRGVTGGTCEGQSGHLYRMASWVE